MKVVGVFQLDPKALLDCPQCRAHAVGPLPPWELAKQTDGTTHVCYPHLGGCNVGFREVERVIVADKLCAECGWPDDLHPHGCPNKGRSN